MTQAPLAIGGPWDDDSLGVLLLVDIHSVLSELGIDKIPTPQLIDELAKVEESPWGDLYGKLITSYGLAKLLKPFRIKTMSIWVDGEKHRGYKLEQFVDAWSRYLPSRAEDGRCGRSGRSGLPSEAVPTTPTAPTTYSTCEGRPPIFGDEMYPVLLAEAVKNGHITHSEAEESYAVHQSVVRTTSRGSENGIAELDQAEVARLARTAIREEHSG